MIWESTVRVGRSRGELFVIRAVRTVIRVIFVIRRIGECGRFAKRPHSGSATRWWISGVCAWLTLGGKAENLHERDSDIRLERRVLMAKVILDLEDPKVLEELGTEWRFGSGWDPGKPNEGWYRRRARVRRAWRTMTIRTGRLSTTWRRAARGRPSGRLHHPGIRKQRSIGFTFGWYRIRIPLPERVGDFEVAGRRSGSRRTSTTTASSGWTASGTATRARETAST